MNKTKKITILALAVLLMSIAITTFANAQDQWDQTNWDQTTADDAAMLFGFGITMCLVIILIPLIIAILVGIWIYKDAEKRGKSGALWLILLIVMSLLFSFIGFVLILIIWLVVRPPIGGEPGRAQQPGANDRMCPSCGRPIPLDAQVCPYCGKDFRQK